MNETLQHGYIEIPVDHDSRWWWDAIAEERLLVPECEACGRCFFPPQPTCTYCGSDSWRAREASGKASVYTWVVVHLPLHPAFKNDAPYAIVAAELEEGVRILGRLNGDLDQIETGAPLAPYFYEAGGRTLVGFELAAG